MTYYEIQTSHGEKIGNRVYFEHSGARSVARRLAGKWSRDATRRGSGMKIVRYDGSLYGDKVVEWINT